MSGRTPASVSPRQARRSRDACPWARSTARLQPERWKIVPARCASTNRSRSESRSFAAARTSIARLPAVGLVTAFPDPLDAVLAQVARLGVDDDLPHQAEADDLHAEDEHEPPDHEQRTVVDAAVVQPVLDADVGAHGRAEEREQTAERAEEAQRLQRELREKEIPDDVEQPRRVDADPKEPRPAPFADVADLELRHAEALAEGDRRQEPVHVAVEVHLVEHFPTERAERAVQIAHLDVDDAPRDPVEERRLEPVQPRIDARMTPGRDEVGSLVDLGVHRPDRGGIDLPGLRARSEDLTARLLVAGGEAHRLAEGLLQPEHLDAAR